MGRSHGSAAKGARGRQATTALAVAAVAALAAGLSPAEPTSGPLDPLLEAGFAFVVTVASSRAKRWFVLPAVALGVLAARGWVLAPAVAACGAALIGARRPGRSRLWGAVTGALAVQALLRLPELGFHGLPSLLVAAAVAPVLVSAYQAARPRERRVVRRVATALGAVVALVVVGYGVLLASAFGDLDEGNAAAREGLAETRLGDTAGAIEAFARAEGAFGRAEGRLGGPWTLPARAVPVLAQHARVVASTAEQGEVLAAQAGAAVEAADYERLRSQGGQFDLERIAATEQPLRETAAAVATARERLARDRSPWLVAPLADELDDLGRELDRAAGEADLAIEGVQVAPRLLGGEGVRRYLVVFVTPVELRGSGGFIGSFAELEVDAGRLRLTRTGSSTELIAPTRDAVVLEGVEEYEARYGAYAAGSDFRDLTFSPHFPYDGEVISQAYPQVGGQEIDGVISLDPIALAGLLQLTGPVDATLFGRTIDAENAVDFLLRDNYSLFPDPEAQNAALRELVEITFDRLTTGDLPGPRTLAEVLGPATRAGRIRLWSPEPAEQRLFSRIGATGAFPEPRPDHDFLAVASQNSGNNKLDLYQRREIAYRPSIDAEGRLTATATVTVRNDVPLDAGLPGYVVGNSQGDPPGTNRMLLTVYSPHLLEGATVDGAEVSVQSQREAGYRAYTVTLVVPPGGSSVLEVQLAGTLDVGEGYVLDLAPQPTAAPDRLALRVGLGDEPPATREPVEIEGRHRITVR